MMKQSGGSKNAPKATEPGSWSMGEGVLRVGTVVLGEPWDTGGERWTLVTDVVLEHRIHKSILNHIINRNASIKTEGKFPFKVTVGK